MRLTTSAAGVARDLIRCICALLSTIVDVRAAQPTVRVGLPARRNPPQLSAVGDDVQLPTGSLSHVADTLCPVSEQVLLTDHPIVLDDQPHEPRSSQRSDDQAAAPRRERSWW
jgi:hypothetical protein